MTLTRFLELRREFWKKATPNTVKVISQVNPLVRESDVVIPLRPENLYRSGQIATLVDYFAGILSGDDLGRVLGRLDIFRSETKIVEFR